MRTERDEVVTAVAAVIEQDGKVLLVRRPEGTGLNCWQLPGGAVRFGESLQEALRRELKESLGVEAAVRSLTPVFVTQTVLPAESRHVICLLYRAEITGGEPRPANGLTGCRYFDGDAAAQAPLSRGCRDLLDRLRIWRPAARR